MGEEQKGFRGHCDCKAPRAISTEPGNQDPGSRVNAVIATTARTVDCNIRREVNDDETRRSKKAGGERTQNRERMPGENRSEGKGLKHSDPPQVPVPASVSLSAPARPARLPASCQLPPICSPTSKLPLYSAAATTRHHLPPVTEVEVIPASCRLLFRVTRQPPTN